MRSRRRLREQNGIFAHIVHITLHILEVQSRVAIHRSKTRPKQAQWLVNKKPTPHATRVQGEQLASLNA